MSGDVPGILLLALPIAFAVAGFVIGRWWVVLGAVATCVGLAIYLYLNDGWFGAGWGDLGIALNIIAAGATILGAAIGVALRYAASGIARARTRA